MDSWILCFSLLLGLVRGQEFQEPTLKECCEDGRNRALGGQDCAIIPLFSSSHVCRIAQEQCCATVVIERLCNNGMDLAKEQGACERPFFQGVPWETRVSKTCCDCCIMGLMALGQGQGCDLGLSLGKSQCAHAAETCCGKNGTEEAKPITQAPLTTDIMSSSDVTSRDATSSSVTSSGVTSIGDTSSGVISSGDTSNDVSSSDVTTMTEKEKDFCQEHNCSQLCLNGACTCRHGYQLKADAVTCEDVNECLHGAYVCVQGQVCINTEGSYRCQRKTSCGTGYQLTDDNQCQDIDECVLGTHYCGESFACNNTPGSFRCHPKERCGDGFIQDAVGSCIDINECVAQTSPCRSGETCINKVGSYTCLKNMVTCGRGYRLIEDGTRCQDVDECRVGDACGGHGCVNLIGTYRCECKAGFVFNSNMKLCEDINECRHYPGRLCAHKCENTEGSYHCSCTTGFKLSNDGRNCEDVNECEAKPCTQECANVYGSYQCYCRRGYQLSDIDGITCEDIDECALPTGGHVCSYRCVNAPGSFFCTCPPTGYTLAPNGRSCQDIDECASGSHSCSVTESCFNIQGGFRCLSFDCPHNFRRASEGRCERVTCEFTRDPTACLSLPLRISFYTVTVPADAPVPADVFRMGPSNSVPGDNMLLNIVSGDEDGYFGTQRQAHGGVISLRRSPTGPRDFFLTVEMRLVRYGRTHLYMAKIAVFVTHEQPLRLAQKNVGSVSVRCVKACQPRDVSCAVDPVRLITHTVISLPTYRDFTAAEDIVFLRTMIPNSPLPGAINVFFDIVASDSDHSFDVVKRVQYDMIMGVVRQVKPIIGPSNVVVEVSMNYIKSGVVSHRNIIVIHIFISEFWF